MSTKLEEFITTYQSVIEKSLLDNLPNSGQPLTDKYNDALSYAVFPGGKRWRPLLAILGGLLTGATVRQMLPAACALEYLHTSSIIIDDLPAMDDADFRRNKQAVHKLFDDSTAILVALSLMNHSYALLAKTCDLTGKLHTASSLIKMAVECIGANGMIGGQVVDLENHSMLASRETLVSRNLKTSGLTELMMCAGGIAMSANKFEIQALSQFGRALGAAYQICDDILDEVSDSYLLGKPAKQDARNYRPNYVNTLGVVGANQMAVLMIDEGLSALRSQFGQAREIELLKQAATMVVSGKPRPLMMSKELEFV